MNKKEIFKALFKKKGKRHEIRKLQEELNELSVEINHLIIKKPNAKEKFYREFADVEIRMEQIKSILDQTKLSKYKKEKLKNYEKRILNVKN